MMEPIQNVEEIDVQKYLLVLQRRWLSAVGVFGVVFTLACLYAFSLKPTYKAEANLLISKNQTSSLTGLGEAIGRLESLKANDSTGTPLDTQVQIITSIPVIEETIKSLNLKDSKGKLLKEILPDQLKVEGVKGTDVVKIAYTDKNPQVAAAVVNKITQVYIRHNIEANRAEAVSARKFIQQQLPGTEATVKQAESALRKFKEENKIISLGEEASAAVNETTKLEDQISQLQAQLDNVTAQSQKLKNQAAVDSQQSVTVASLSEIPGIQQLLAQLQDAQSQLVLMRTRFQPGHPSVIDLEKKVAALNSLLQQRIKQNFGSDRQVRVGNLQTGVLRQQLMGNFARAEVEEAGLKKQITALDNKLTAYKKRASILPRLEQTQRQLERRLKAAQTTYEALLSRLQEVQVTENQNIGNARVISPALIPDKPASSIKKMIIGGGAVFGVVLGLIAAFTLDIIDSSIKTVKEAKEMFQYTLLGVIPSAGRSGANISLRGLDQPIPKVIGRDIPLFPIGEAYQMLQANLKFLSSDKELKTLVVTSSVAKEGKSEVATNLAVVMAQAGRRVLLIDANMRHPIQHHIWKRRNDVGLSHVLVEGMTLLDAAIQEATPNLWVMPSGVIPPNPVALLDSKLMSTMVDSFAEKYDFVIFDSPPLAGTADAAVLGNLTDGILLVVRPGVVDSGSVKAAKEFLGQSGQKVLGIVINGVDVNREPDSYFYYTRAQSKLNSVSRGSFRGKQASLRGDRDVL